MSVGVDIRGMPEVLRALEQLQGPPLRKTLQKASNAAGRALKPHVQAAAPVGPPGNRVTKRGALRRSVSTRQARRDRPAAVVSARPKVAFYRHMVIGGTRPHRIRTHAQKLAGVGKSQGAIRHPGARPKPFIAQGFARGERDALAAIDRVIAEALAAL